MIIRYLGHDGVFHYFAATNNAGKPIFVTDVALAFIFPSEHLAQTIAHKCTDAGINNIEITL